MKFVNTLVNCSSNYVSQRVEKHDQRVAEYVDEHRDEDGFSDIIKSIDCYVWILALHQVLEGLRGAVLYVRNANVDQQDDDSLQNSVLC